VIEDGLRERIGLSRWIVGLRGCGDVGMVDGIYTYIFGGLIERTLM
jgi:hypothetical protein